MKKVVIFNILFTVVMLIAIFIAYLKYALNKFEFDFKIKSYTPKKIDITGTGNSVVQIVLEISVKSALFFSIPVNSLYYEIYYKDGLLGKSANVTSFTLTPNQFVTFTEPIDISITNQNVEVAKNYISKIPTNFTAKIKVKIFGINIKLTELRFTY